MQKLQFAWFNVDTLMKKQWKSWKNESFINRVIENAEWAFRNKIIDIIASIASIVIAIESVSDHVFSEKTVGDEVAIQTDDNQFFAPMNGEVTVVE